jgi:hypothetical protein
VAVIVALGAGLMLARSWQRDQLTSIVQDTEKYSIMPESPEVSKMSEFTITEPILSPSYFGEADR